MKRMKIGYFLLLISGVLAGCGSVKSSGQIEKYSQNIASANIVQPDSKTPDKILFKGNNITVIEKENDVFKQLRFDRGKKSCLNKVDEEIEKKLSALGFNGNTEYSEFEAVETNSFGAEKFTVNFDKNLFLKINPDSLKKLDKYVGFTDFRGLYFLKNNNNNGYLLLIGHESATSGMGHYYRTHLLVPLDLNRAAIDFQSISDDPRRIKIADSGAIYYAQVDLADEAIKDHTSKRVSLTESLFAVDNTNNKRLETKFDLRCENLDAIFERL